MLTAAAGLFAYRLGAGPSLADRVVALNGLVIVGMAAIATHAAHTAVGSFLPTLVAISLVGPIGNGMIARFIEERKS
jgi:multicomponent Na+:H+ antiporter subunit F